VASILSDDTLRGRRGPDDEAPALPDGTTLADGRYRIDGVLGRGGFGITYAATDLRLERPVAVKELFPDGAGRDGTDVAPAVDTGLSFARARERFRREATTLARFGHPNIVRIFAVLEENATAYLVLEKLEGRTLADELRQRRGPFTEAEALDVAEQAADALAAVHLAGVLHRDVSPANLMRTEDGRVVLIDFGLARPYVEDRTTMMTRIVTPGYAPPEQHTGSGRFSPRADVYALGATLHRLLSGRVPPVAAERAHHDDLAPLWRINPTVSRRTSDAIAAALDLDPAARPGSVAVLLERLGVHVEGLGAPDLIDLRDEIRPIDPPPRSPDGDLPDDEATEYVAPVDAIGRSPRREGLAGSDDTGARPTDAVLATASAAPAAPIGSWVVPAPVVDDTPAPAGTARSARFRFARAERIDADQRAALAAGEMPAGRRWLTVPLGAAAIALASAQPAGIVALLGLGVAPLLATAGDVVMQPDRNPLWWPLWWARNVALGLIRSLGALVVMAIGLCLWFGTDAFEGLSSASPYVLRATGLLAGGILALSIGRGGPGFRSHLALDALTRRLLPRGKPTMASAIVGLVALAIVAAGLSFRPEAWPLG
jgi:serine/threonine protein kinase